MQRRAQNGDKDYSDNNAGERIAIGVYVMKRVKIHCAIVGAGPVKSNKKKPRHPVMGDGGYG